VAFGDRHPGVNIQLSVFNREELLHQLGGNRVDLAVMVRPPGDIDTINESFAPHPYVIVAPPGHPLCTRRAIPIEVLLEQPFIMRERGSDTWNSMHEAFGRHFARVHTGLEVASTETIKQAVIAGMGLAFLSAHTIDAQRRLGELVVLDVAGFPARFDWFLVHRRNKRLPAAAQAFREFLLAEGAALIGRLFPDADPGAGKPRPARGRRA
jgi:DNA-binding transcriptional LysR family regulator